MTASICSWSRAFEAIRCPAAESNGALIPERVEPPRGNVAEIERGGSQSPNGAGTTEELTEERDEITGVLVNVVWKAGDDQ